MPTHGIIWDDERGPLSPSPTPEGAGPQSSVEWDKQEPAAPSASNPLNLFSALSETFSAPIRKAFELAGELDVRAGIKTPEQAASRAGTYTNIIVPQTATDWALLGAFPGARAGAGLVTRSPLGQRALGTVGTALAGGAASQAETGEALPGIARGGAVGGIGALPAVGGFLWRATPIGKRQVLQSMEREVLEEVAGKSAAFKGIKPGEQFYRQAVVFPRELQAKFSEQFVAGIQKASALAPGNVITSPRLVEVWSKIPKTIDGNVLRAQLSPVNGKFSVEQATELLSIARAGTYRGARLTTEKATKQTVVQAYQNARSEVYKSLPPDAAEVLEQTRILHGVNRGLAAVFKEGGALEPGFLGPRLNPNKALAYMEKAGDQLRLRIGNESFAALHAALSRGGKLGERHDFGERELIPGILERSIVITRSILKSIGISPMKMGGTRPQPFTPGRGVETAVGVLGGQAAKEASRTFTEGPPQ